jgi:serine/threonine-protein kinase
MTSNKNTNQKSSSGISKVEGSVTAEVIADQYINMSEGRPASSLINRFPTLIGNKIKGFVGREYVFDAINKFIAQCSNGYFTIIGDPGQGKSTILAKYVQDNDCIAHFNIAVEGPNRANEFLKNIFNQLIQRYELPYDSLPDNAMEDGQFLVRLLDEAVQKSKGEALIIVVDALDEVDRSNDRKGTNILYLPAYLPEKVYFILTRRRDVEVDLTNYVSNQILNLADYKANGERDIRTYIENRMSNSEKLRQWIEKRGQIRQEFTDKIAEKSENNFMYLRDMLLDIENGKYNDLALEQFPQGLQNYYNFHWERMGMKNELLSVAKIKLVYILGVVSQPISRSKICDFSGEEEYTVQQVLNEWKQFLHKIIDGKEKSYIVYHSSFRDFLYRKEILEMYPVELPDINRLIAEHE